MAIVLIVVGLLLWLLTAGVLSTIGFILMIVGVVLLLASLLGGVGPAYGVGYSRRRGPP